VIEIVSRTATKRHLKELLHVFKYTYEEISKVTEIPVERLKAINKKEEPTEEEAAALRELAITATQFRSEETFD